MTLICLGADFHDTPLRLLAELESRSEAIRTELFARAGDLVSGVVLVSTCNRFEIYLQSNSSEEQLDWVIEIVSRQLELEPDAAQNLFSIKRDLDAVKHLFLVCSGLNSMAIGETEITGQVRQALNESAQKTNLPSELGQVFGSALRLAKKIGTETELREVSQSVISKALGMVSGSFDALRPAKALLIGTGSFARVVSKTLIRAGGFNISVFSRSGRAELFAARYGYTALTGETLVEAIAEADLVISVSGGPGHVITSEIAARAMQLRRLNHVLPILDLALSKDVAPEVAEVPGVQILDLEVLRGAFEQVDVNQLDQAHAMVEKAVAEIELNALIREVDPVITALRKRVDNWVALEIESVRRREGDEAAEKIQRSLRRVTRAIMHAPSVKGKELAREGRQQEYVAAMNVLFDLEVPSGS